MVQLIVYPAENSNTFVDLVSADLLAEQMFGYDEWMLLSDDDKGRYLITAYYTIVQLDGIFLPASPEECLNSAQVAIAINDVKNGISNQTSQAQVIQKAKVGPIEVQYQDGSDTASAYEVIPTQAMFCLQNSYGATSTSSNQIRLFRS